jgi:hypothetical protein
MRVQVDHIVMVVPELKEAAQHVLQLLGLEAIPGGRHDRAGTENLIVPMGSSYLELVTVTRREEAAGNPFGRFVQRALSRAVLLAGWAAPLTGGPPPGVSQQRLTRNGAAVELYGVDETEGRTHQPFLIRRPQDQRFPGMCSSDPRRISSILVAKPDEEPWTTMPIGQTDLLVSPSSAVQGALLGLTVEDSTGQSIVLDQRSWAAAC